MDGGLRKPLTLSAEALQKKQQSCGGAGKDLGAAVAPPDAGQAGELRDEQGQDQQKNRFCVNQEIGFHVFARGVEHGGGYADECDEQESDAENRCNL